jgi:hypothetical protein
MLSNSALHVEAKRVKVPKRTPVKKQDCDAELFSTPDAEGDVVPAFVGKKGQPINMDMEPRIAGFEHAKLLSDLTAEQKRKINALQSETNMAVQAIQEHINSLNQKLDVVKGHPSEKIIIQSDSLPNRDQIKSEIAELRKKIQDKKRAAAQQLETILTVEQKDQIKRMRHGELLRDMQSPSVEQKGQESRK